MGGRIAETDGALEEVNISDTGAKPRRTVIRGRCVAKASSDCEFETALMLGVGRGCVALGGVYSCEAQVGGLSVGSDGDVDSSG